MHYQISRNGQQYGPYTLDDLQRYLISGNVLPTDLAKSEEMPDWIPVSELLAVAAPVAAAPEFSSPSFADPTTDPLAYGQPTALNPMVSGSMYADPPNLHWGLVLLFAFVSSVFLGGLFMTIWNLVMTAWLRRVQPNCDALFYYIAAPVLAIVGLVPCFVVLGRSAKIDPNHPNIGAAIGLMLVLLVVWALRILGRFAERAGLEEHYNTVEPMGLRLGPVMTFFFGGIYFQYHINRIVRMKQAMRYGAPRSF
jgi:hypothetical protein